MIKGVYALLLQISKNISVCVGSLGTLNFKRVFYVYVGSAQNNLEKRVVRHCRGAKRKFWHVDYLLNSRFVSVAGVLFKVAGKAEECLIAKRLQSVGVPVARFGSSDCRCTSHLYRVRSQASTRNLLSDMIDIPLEEVTLHG